MDQDKQEDKTHFETATLAGGCFWCTEAIFKRLKGVESVISGYAGGATGRAEAIQIEFDPKIIPYEKILDVFWATHDPTTLNRQGNDVGTAYRSAIFYHSAKQKQIAEASKEKLEKSGKHKDKIVTTIEPFSNFYKAENYHQNYYANNSSAPYCTFVIDPKIKRLYKEFGDATLK
jgi:peptide-methionine (S)-S-oxide reductase